MRGERVMRRQYGREFERESQKEEEGKEGKYCIRQ
jgi:hypothetical protein